MKEIFLSFLCFACLHSIAQENGDIEIRDGSVFVEEWGQTFSRTYVFSSESNVFLNQSGSLRWECSGTQMGSLHMIQFAYIPAQDKYVITVVGKNLSSLCTASPDYIPDGFVDGDHVIFGNLLSIDDQGASISNLEIIAKIPESLRPTK